ncbi:MAG: roadblock/LC7 family [Actinobacteria bacterium]|nr:MAG: roadblock/LC7 family [Actinomycetota bacterium]
MVDTGIGDYFISDAEDDLLDDEALASPVVVPIHTPVPAPVPARAPMAAPDAAPPAPVLSAPAPVQQSASVNMAPAQSQPVVATQQQDVARRSTREEQLAAALDRLMQEDPDIQAAALVSLDGFTMASALPEGMQPDRVGAMSAAILGLGERAAAELGRGHLSQVFIQGDSGYVLLMSVGERAVLTAMADANAKLGLVLYDMRAVADDIAGILG